MSGCGGHEFCEIKGRVWEVVEEGEGDEGWYLWPFRVVNLRGMGVEGWLRHVRRVYAGGGGGEER